MNVNALVLAGFLNLTEQRVYQLVAQGVIPKAGRALYPFGAAVRAYVRFLQQTASGTEQVNPDQLEPFRRKAYYQAESEKMRLAEAAGELIARADVETAMAATAKVVARFMDVLPDALERDCGATAPMLAKVEELLDKTREDIYQELICQPTPERKVAGGS